MRALEYIEEIVANGLKGLCLSCVHRHSCVYRQRSTRNVIQCEMFELDTDGDIENTEEPAGLCRTCDHARGCKLVGRKTGVWHCNEYE